MKAVNGQHQEFVDTSRNLANGGSYRYRIERYTTNTWQALFCSGSGCTPMISGNLGVDTLPYVASGGESSGVNWGSIETSNARYYTPGGQ